MRPGGGGPFIIWFNLILAWISSYIHYTVWGKIISQIQHEGLRMDKYLHSICYWACAYLSLLWFKSICVCASAQNGQDFENILKCVFFNLFWNLFIKVRLTKSKLCLVLVMTWCCQTTIHYIWYHQVTMTLWALFFSLYNSSIPSSSMSLFKPSII